MDKTYIELAEEYADAWFEECVTVEAEVELYPTPSDPTLLSPFHPDELPF